MEKSGIKIQTMEISGKVFLRLIVEMDGEVLAGCDFDAATGLAIARELSEQAQDILSRRKAH